MALSAISKQFEGCASVLIAWLSVHDPDLLTIKLHYLLQIICILDFLVAKFEHFPFSS